MFKRRHYKWNDGKELQLHDGTLIMGILNGTPDSFSDGGLYNSVDAAVQHVKDMIVDGADLIDLGVESTSTYRPGFTPLTAEEEIERLESLLEPVLGASTVPVSIDTYHAKTADYAFSKGVHILNDIWGLHYDRDMADVAAKHRVPVIIMHNSNDTDYGDIIEDMKAFFFTAVDKALKAGIMPQNIWLDPGIGFGKTEAQNIEVMQRLGEITAHEFPVLLAPSRKRFIGAMLGNVPPEERDEGTVATCITGVFQGVDMVRVHNVKMHKRALAVADGLLRGE
ncbi:dihydropteroate synthase [Veillonella sp. YH-vei2232]|uniref:Dihydropteroate synthase n=1 Tax=Veillonella absiana TaxID=3079305 RepID=A0ABU3Z9Q5_9FIRM|nr:MULTISPECIES: dihydropteroate synthase [unclassified Veillonella]MDV5063173.1 dihydropteroate synthase [Veillonella sp. YH-vei2232]MDV5088649.1 dihydropteroate synthase [Veillonella sp. YH-vei2233]